MVTIGVFCGTILSFIAAALPAHSCNAGLSGQERLPRDGGDGKLPSPSTRSPPPLSNLYLLRVAKSEERIYESLLQLLSSPRAQTNAELKIHIIRFDL